METDKTTKLSFPVEGKSLQNKYEDQKKEINSKEQDCCIHRQGF